MVYKIISGKLLINLLCKKYGYIVVSQKGSHIKIKYFSGKTIIIPNHPTLKIGTFNSILSFVGEDIKKDKNLVFEELFS